MKITKTYIQNLVKEELNKTINEMDAMGRMAAGGGKKMKNAITSGKPFDYKGTTYVAEYGTGSGDGDIYKIYIAGRTDGLSIAKVYIDRFTMDSDIEKAFAKVSNMN